MPAPAEAVPNQAGAGHLFCLTGSSVRSGVGLCSGECRAAQEAGFHHGASAPFEAQDLRQLF